MRFSTITTLFALGSLAAASVIPTDNVLEPRDTKYLLYCDLFSKSCGHVKATGKCQSSTGRPAPMMFIDKGLKCNIWQEKGCQGKKKAKGIKVAFNTHNNLVAKKQGITAIGSFKCHK